MSTRRDRFTLEGVTDELRQMLFDLAYRMKCSKSEVFRRALREKHAREIGEKDVEA